MEEFWASRSQAHYYENLNRNISETGTALKQNLSEKWPL